MKRGLGRFHYATLLLSMMVLELYDIRIASAETLVEALVSAYATNPTLKAEQARQRGTDEEVPQALSGWRPTVTARGSLGQSWSDTNVAKSSSYTPLSVTISLSQPVFRGFKTINGTKSAEASVEAGRQRLLAVEQSVIFQALQAYMNVLRDRQIVGFRQQNLNALRQQLQDVTARFAVGEVTRTDVAQSRARVAGALAGKSSAMANLASSVASYVKIIGHAPGTLKYPIIARLPRSLDQAQSIAQEINPSILGAAYIERSAGFDVEVAKGDLLPEFNLAASATASLDPQQSVDHSHSASIEGVLSVPIYEAGQVYSRVRQSKQLASQHKLEVIAEGRRVRESVSNAWNNVEAARESIHASKAQVAANELALDGVRKEYQVGSRSTLDVLNAQSELVSARITLVSAEHDRVVAAYLLLSSVGTLTARDLNLPAAYYDADENYLNVRGKWIGAGAETVQ
jgi:outer membrane protein